MVKNRHVIPRVVRGAHEVRPDDDTLPLELANQLFPGHFVPLSMLADASYTQMIASQVEDYREAGWQVAEIQQGFRNEQPGQTGEA